MNYKEEKLKEFDDKYGDNSAYNWAMGEVSEYAIKDFLHQALQEVASQVLDDCPLKEKIPANAEGNTFWLIGYNDAVSEYEEYKKQVIGDMKEEDHIDCNCEKCKKFQEIYG